MRSLLPHLWPGVWLFLAVVSSGCVNCRQCRCNRCPNGCCPCTAPAAMKNAPIVASYPAYPAPAGSVKHVATYPPLPPIVDTKQPAQLPTTNTAWKAPLAPVSSAGDAWVQRARREPTSVPVSAAANAWVQPVVKPVTTVVAKPKKTKPQPVTVVAAKKPMPTEAAVPPGARYGHDANYHCLVGTLEYSRIQDAWLLRYVSYEEEDRYGGCVTLVAPGRGIQLKEGQTVRVEGGLIDPESQQLRPAFEVRKIRPAGS